MTNTTFFGKELKEFTSQWNYVPNSTRKLSEEQLKAVSCITVKPSKKGEGKYALIIIGNKCATMTLDLNCTLECGDDIDPQSFRVKSYSNGEKTIIRCSGSRL